MRLGQISRGAALATLACLAVSTSAPAQQSKTGDRPKVSSSSKAANVVDRAAGVITKVERVSNGPTTSREGGDSGRARGGSHRITINMNEVWRDWARDQSQTKDKGPASKDAAKGENSVASRGEPADKNSLVVIDIGPDTRVETRFRAADDETSKGSKTPEAAGAAGDRGKEKSSGGKAVQFHADDLKPGLFVEVDYRHASARNPAISVTVIRPIGGPDSGAADRRK